MSRPFRSVTNILHVRVLRYPSISSSCTHHCKITLHSTNHEPPHYAIFYNILELPVCLFIEGPRSRCYGRTTTLKAYCATVWWRGWGSFSAFPFNGVPVEWNWQGKTEVLGEKPVPVPLYPPQIPHGSMRNRSRASAVNFLLVPHIIISTLFSNAFSLRSFFSAKDQVTNT
jgi:hypothetical protein